MGFGKGKGFTEIPYLRWYPTTLTIPIPTVSVVTAEDHSGGAHTATATLTIPEPSISATAEVV